MSYFVYNLKVHLSHVKHSNNIMSWFWELVIEFEHIHVNLVRSCVWPLTLQLSASQNYFCVILCTTEITRYRVLNRCKVSYGQLHHW
ncbi:unnamed protein product [Cuscuta campestris]|uniref:Uncharacterized protein n=1 Tax=Cuscuta campestris TaxID=132261 RepID=A0A484K833_9ASTE|nr:unnamed protein product [Cuscuta campestris]